MSRQTDILNSVREVPMGDKLKTEQTISLVDHTQSLKSLANTRQMVNMRIVM